MDLIFQKIKKNLNKLKIKDCSILLAFSGGMDSIFLLYILNILKKEFNIKLFLGYVNHNLRDDSSQEEEFVKKTAEEFNIPLFKCTIDKQTWNNLNGESIESKARKLRYEFLKKTADENNIDNIATAHHFNDRIETFFINIIRAGGLDTLRSIPFKNKNIIRTILNVTKKEIKNYVKNNNIDYYEDKTNKENIYKRNIIRNKLLPVLREIHPDYDKSFSHVFNFIEEEEEFIRSYTVHIYKKILINETSGRIIINFESFKKLKPYIKKCIAKIILKKMGYPVKPNLSFFNAVCKDKINYKKSNLVTVSKSGNLWFINSAISFNNNIDKAINSIPDKIKVENYYFCFNKSDIKDPKKQFSFKYSKSDFPLFIKNMNNQNRHYVVNILEKMKIPKILYNDTLVIENKNNEIIAIYNNSFYRVSYNFYINENDKETAEIVIR